MSKQEGVLQFSMWIVADYIIANYNNGWDIKVALRKLQDPNTGLKGKQNPKSLTE